MRPCGAEDLRRRLLDRDDHIAALAAVARRKIGE
jgi:hypothetical protein